MLTFVVVALVAVVDVADGLVLVLLNMSSARSISLLALSANTVVGGDVGVGGDSGVYVGDSGE